MAKINDDNVSVSSAADTGGESASDHGGSSETEEGLASHKTKLLAAPDGPSELVAAVAKTHLPRTPVWDNGYFYIADNRGNPDVKILMHKYWPYEPLVAWAWLGVARRSPQRITGNQGKILPGLVCCCELGC